MHLDIECIRVVEGLRALTLKPEFREHGISSIDTARLADTIGEIQQAYALKFKTSPV